MFISYYDLRNLVMDLSTYYKEEDIKGFINKLVSFGKIDNIINNISISKGNDQYEIFFFGNRLGSFKSDFDYTIEKNDSKMRLLKYILYRDFDTIVPKFLDDLLNINCKLLSDSSEDISMRSKVVDVDLNNRRKLNDEIDALDCKIRFDVYGSNCMIGFYNYNGDCYVSNYNKTVDDISKSLEQDIFVDDKKVIIKNLMYTKYVYFKNNIEKNLTKNDSKRKN